MAIAIHNIPEGIAVSVPLYYATGNRKKAGVWSALSGLAEPVGALFGYVVLHAVSSEAAMGAVHAAVAGIMVFVALDQLIPNAHQYAKGHLPMYGLVAGMAVMAGNPACPGLSAPAPPPPAPFTSPPRRLGSAGFRPVRRPSRFLFAAMKRNV